MPGLAAGVVALRVPPGSPFPIPLMRGNLACLCRERVKSRTGYSTFIRGAAFKPTVSARYFGMSLAASCFNVAMEHSPASPTDRRAT